MGVNEGRRDDQREMKVAREARKARETRESVGKH